MKQQTKMVQQDMVIKGALQHAHDVNTLQRQLAEEFFRFRLTAPHV